MNESQRVGSFRALDLLFYLGFALLVCHELDAVAQAEWRLLPVLKNMGDEQAYRAFVVLHVPLFAILMWLTASRSRRIRLTTQLVIDVFMLAHAGLHLLFVNNDQYHFHSALSETLIFGAGAVGFIHLSLAVAAIQRTRHGGSTIAGLWLLVLSAGCVSDATQPYSSTSATNAAILAGAAAASWAVVGCKVNGCLLPFRCNEVTKQCERAKCSERQSCPHGWECDSERGDCR
jgi:hypothetical protein